LTTVEGKIPTLVQIQVEALPVKVKGAALVMVKVVVQASRAALWQA
jgi:hypothetical protein